MPIVNLAPNKPLEIGPQPPADPYVISNPNDWEGQYTLAPKGENLVVQYFLPPHGEHRFNVDRETTITNDGKGDLSLQTVGL